MKKMFFSLLMCLSLQSAVVHAQQAEQTVPHLQEVEAFVGRMHEMYASAKNDPKVVAAMEEYMQSFHAFVRVASEHIAQSLTESEKAVVVFALDYCIDLINDTMFRTIISRGNMEELSKQEQDFLLEKAMVIAPILQEFGPAILHVLCDTLLDIKTVTVKQNNRWVKTSQPVLKPDSLAPMITFSFDQWNTVLHEMKVVFQP